MHDLIALGYLVMLYSAATLAAAILVTVSVCVWPTHRTGVRK